MVACGILGAIGTIFRDAVGAFFKWAWKKMIRKKAKVITGTDTMPEKPKTLDEIDEEIERESRETMRALAQRSPNARPRSLHLGNPFPFPCWLKADRAKLRYAVGIYSLE